jgi:hypothetical protein
LCRRRQHSTSELHATCRTQSWLNAQHALPPACGAYHMRKGHLHQHAVCAAHTPVTVLVTGAGTAAGANFP